MRNIFILLIALAVLLPSQAAWAQTKKSDFGNFEVLHQLNIGGVTINQNIQEFIKSAPDKKPIVYVADVAFQIGLGILIMISVIIVVAGGYIYMTAGGEGGKIENAKKMIGAALAGIVIGLTGWLLLNTISSQFTDPAEPTLQLPSASPTP